MLLKVRGIPLEQRLRHQSGGLIIQSNIFVFVFYLQMQFPDTIIQVLVLSFKDLIG